VTETLRVPRVGFLLEQTLGHVTHSDNLEHIITNDRSIEAAFVPIPYEVKGIAAKIPGYGNWSLRAGLLARLAVSALERSARLDALFIHTQVPAILVNRPMKRIPTIVSLDATPIQYDGFGSHYNHQRGNSVVERAKWVANRNCYKRADSLVAWSEWTKTSIVEDYGIDPDRVTVIAPGVIRSAWTPPADMPSHKNVVRILFVGGDLDRKGGTALIAAFRTLRVEHEHDASHIQPRLELHLVTRAAVADEPGVVVHNNMQPNSDELKALFHASDIFCLPTRGDCLPMVLSEAGAANLPLVSTPVGAIDEIVIENETGLLVPPDDVRALVTALRALIDDPELRRRLGHGASQVVRRSYDAERNAELLVSLLHKAAVR